MKNKRMILTVVSTVILLLAAGITAVCLRNQVRFDGDRISNADAYHVEFKRMQMKDTDRMTLEAGDELHVWFEITSGSADLIITAPDGTEIYRGNHIDKGDFTVVVPEAGVYIVTLDANQAAGAVHVEKMGDNETAP